MEVQSTMDFSMPNFLSGKITNIGSVGETVWSLLLFFDIFGNYSLRVIRSLGNGKVTIDVGVNLGEYRLVLKEGLSYLDGQKIKYFMGKRPCGVYNNSSLKGYITVHCDSIHTLTSSSEEDTPSERKASSPRMQKKKINPLPQLRKDLLNLLDNPDYFSDATLICGTAKIPVHRVILSARSPVFAAMFKSQMQEGRDGIVDIVDMKSDAVDAMLRYIYSGKTDHLTCSLAGDLLFAADKYQLEELKLICVEELKASMATNNVFRSLVLGDLHDKSLKAHAVQFICNCKNFSDLEKSYEWQSLLKAHPYLAVDLLTTVVKYLQKK